MVERKQSGMYQLVMLALSVLVLLALAVDTFFRLDEDTARILLYVDTFICLLFFCVLPAGMRNHPSGGLVGHRLRRPLRLAFLS